MKEKITAFIKNLIAYDYILFGSVFFLFIVLIIIAIILRRNVALSVSIVLLSFATLFLGPTFGYIKMHEYLFKNSTQLISQKRLQFVQAIVVKGSLTNESNYEFSSCNITASAYKITGNTIKDMVFSLKPLKNMSILENNISQGETREFKIIVEPFFYQGAYDISLGADCK